MPAYKLPRLETLPRVKARQAYLIASGDFREVSNTTCWPAQQQLEAQVRAAFDDLGWSLVRAGDGPRHGFIDSQARGREVFATIPREAPLVIAEAVWQYSQHVLVGLQHHRGPILAISNWSGRWPGLVGLLNLCGSLTKAGVEYSRLWGADFSDEGFRKKLRQWTAKGRVKHDLSHVRRLDPEDLPAREARLGRALADQLRRRPAIMGVFDEGCMGMFNAIIPDHLLHRASAFKERLSQSQLFAAMQRTPDAEADAARAWLDARGMRFAFGPDPVADLSEAQVREQLKMYIAAARIGDSLGCDAIGIQYQLGLADLTAASDLAEGLLNCSERPPVVRADGSVIREGRPFPHFNEVDECAGLDAILTERVWEAMDLAPDSTLHDVRWADADASGTTDADVWVFEISGAVPPSHLVGGYAGAVSERQPAVYFARGGGGIKGVSREGDVVWSRIYVKADRLCMDIGRASAISLPAEETRRRWDATTPQWPIMHAVLHGVSRDQLMAKHESNHIQVVYAPSAKVADRALAAKAALAHDLGIRVNLCGDAADGTPLHKRLASL